MSLDEINSWKNEIQQSDNMMLDESGDYKTSFYHSHAMISDASSLALEYLYTQKPVLFTFDKGSDWLNEDRYIIDYLYQGKKTEDVEDFIQMIGRYEDPMLPSRLGIMDQFMYQVDGNAGKRIYSHMIDDLIYGKIKRLLTLRA